MQTIDEIIDWGLIPYADAWDRQTKLFNEALERKQKNEKPIQKLILCEHPHVITLGKRGDEHNLLSSREFLQQKEVDFFHIDRGGDITYHGPGQLVVYPIFDLDAFEMGLKTYIHSIEEVVIRLLSNHGIKAERKDRATGVWLDSADMRMARKMCAIGVRSSRFVTMHGLALNVNTDLKYFSLINPCGFTESGVTSIRKELNVEHVDMGLIKKELTGLFNDIFTIEK